MESNAPRPSRVKKGENRPSPTNLQMFINESTSKKKKKVLINKGARSASPFTDPMFQIPESDKNGRYLPPPSEEFNKPSVNYANSQYSQPRTRTYDPYGQNVNSQPQNSKHRRNKPNRNDETPDNFRNADVNEQPTNDPYSQQMYTNYPPRPTAPPYRLDESPSLICRPVNYHGEPVKVNDQVIKDKLILSCRPRTFYGLQTQKPPSGGVGIDRGQKNIPPPATIDVQENVHISRTTDIDIQDRLREAQSRQDRDRSKPPLERSDAFDAGSLGLGDRRGLEPTPVRTQTELYKEQYKLIQCTRYIRNFRKFLWALFILNLLLLITALTILLLCLHHMIFLSYIDTVLGYQGLVIWVWIALLLSLVILTVAVYGIITAVTRRKRMIQAYIICALVTIVLIVIFLLVYWLLLKDMKHMQTRSMEKSKGLYRCQRLVRHAWDSLQEQFQCCGIQNKVDWLYIPPSCCQEQNKFAKLKCINHYIQFEQAYKNGCRGKVEEYFNFLFLLITVLLVLALILLILAIIVAWRLLKVYKIMVLCRDTYAITTPNKTSI